MSTHVDFEFSKDFGIHKKGDRMKLDRTLAHQLKTERKVGKFVTEKVEKPKEDKSEKKASTRATK